MAPCCANWATRNATRPRLPGSSWLKILELTLNPRPQDCKPIDAGYRVDSGEYRIYYEVDDAHQVIDVLLVGKRGDDEIYRRLKRKFG